VAHDAASRATTQSGEDAGALVVEATTAVTGINPTHAIGLTKKHPKQPAISIKHCEFQRAAQAAIPPTLTSCLIHG